jgi:hypothetical protein
MHGLLGLKLVSVVVLVVLVLLPPFLFSLLLYIANLTACHTERVW